MAPPGFPLGAVGVGGRTLIAELNLQQQLVKKLKKRKKGSGQRVALVMTLLPNWKGQTSC